MQDEDLKAYIQNIGFNIHTSPSIQVLIKPQDSFGWFLPPSHGAAAHWQRSEVPTGGVKSGKFFFLLSLFH